MAGLAFATGLCACSAENPFEDEGVGTVYLRPIVNSITTRAENDAEYDYYANGEVKITCIEGSEGHTGVVYKETGFSNVSGVLTLRAGKYVAEAWTGDSLAASFTQKYYRGYQAFDVNKCNITNVVLNCKIQNVVVSIDVNDAGLQAVLAKTKDFAVTVDNNGHDGGSLSFNADNFAEARGYFMMSGSDSDLQYTISGTKSDGTAIANNQRKIENVKRGYHYILKFSYTEKTDDDTVGSIDTSAINVTVVEEDTANTEESESSLFPTDPAISGVGFDLALTQDFSDDADIPDNLAVMICTIGYGLNAATLKGYSADEIDLLSDNTLPAGIEWLAPDYNSTTNVSTAFILFSREYILSLEGPHSFVISATDINSKTSTATLSISRPQSDSSDLTE